MLMKHSKNKTSDMTVEKQLKVAMGIIDDYLNAGCKDSRRKASYKAKLLYEEYHGKEYENKPK